MEANSESVVAALLPSVETMNGGEEPMRLCLMLLGQLEASLEGSRKALLARDLAGIEAGTREQRALAGKIEAVTGKGIVALGSGLELKREVRESAKRVRAAARLQAALLVRARRQLRVLANVLAGPSANYGPIPEPGRDDSCRV